MEKTIIPQVFREVMHQSTSTKEIFGLDLALRLELDSNIDQDFDLNQNFDSNKEIDLCKDLDPD